MTKSHDRRIASVAVLCEDDAAAATLWYRLKNMGETTYQRGRAVAVSGDLTEYVAVLSDMLGLGEVHAILRPSFRHAKTRVNNQELFNERTWTVQPSGHYVDWDGVRSRAAS